MSDRIKKIKVKKQDGTFSDYIPIGADAEYIDMADGDNLQEEINTINNKIENELSKLEIYVGKEEPVAGEKVWFRKGKNLFDKSKALLGYWIDNEQGDAGKGTDDVFLTDFIPVFKNVPVYIPATDSARREFYNKNKVGITYLNNAKAQVFTPTEDGFIRVTCKISTVTMDSLMIYYGTTETEYEAYIEPQIFVKNSNGVYEEFATKTNSSDVYTKTETDTKLNKKQEKLTAGTGIEITGTNIINNLNANYSTNEVRIGTWIDGKPLYRKVIQTTTPTVSTNGTAVWRQVMIENVSFGRLVSADNETNFSDGKSFGSILSYMRTSPYFIRSYFTVNMSSHKGILEIRSDDTAFNDLNVIAIVEYTKTTD